MNSAAAFLPEIDMSEAARQLHARRFRDFMNQSSSKQVGGGAEEILHTHYFRPCPYDSIDVYRIIDLFEVTHPCAQHVLKKVLATGKRGHKSIDKDIQDMIDTLERWKRMRVEDNLVLNMEIENEQR